MAKPWRAARQLSARHAGNVLFAFCWALMRGAHMTLYVIQVVGGTESRVCDLINKLLNDIVDDCFVPRREVMRREEG